MFTGGEWDFGGDRQSIVVEPTATLTFRTFWSLNGYVDYFPRSYDHSATRGGPEAATPQNWDVVWRLGNSFGAKTAWSFRVFYGGDELGGQTYRLSGGLLIRPGGPLKSVSAAQLLRGTSPRQ